MIGDISGEFGAVLFFLPNTENSEFVFFGFLSFSELERDNPCDVGAVDGGVDVRLEPGDAGGVIPFCRDLVRESELDRGLRAFDNSERPEGSGA